MKDDIYFLPGLVKIAFFLIRDYNRYRQKSEPGDGSPAPWKRNRSGGRFMENNLKNSCMACLILMVLSFAVSGCGQKTQETEVQTTVVESTELSTAQTMETVVPENTTAAENDHSEGDFDVSNPKWNSINWDADGDGTEEELFFEYHDNGDEAPSIIEVTLYLKNDELQTMIDRAYGLNRILAKEDAEGPYLQIDYVMGDYYSHDAEGHCILRLTDGELVLTEGEVDRQ